MASVLAKIWLIACPGLLANNGFAQPPEAGAGAVSTLSSARLDVYAADALFPSGRGLRWARRRYCAS